MKEEFEKEPTTEEALKSLLLYFVTDAPTRIMFFLSILFMFHNYQSTTRNKELIEAIREEKINPSYLVIYKDVLKQSELQEQLIEK